jgi:carbamoyltransferase
MHTLGINAAFHDSAASLVKDGELIAAAEEERFTHVKHAKRPIPFSAYELPYHAIDYCLREAGVPVLVNTSFNTRGEPIVCTPRDAVECFWTSPFDALVINSFLLEK